MGCIYLFISFVDNVNEVTLFNFQSWVSRQVGCRQEVELDPYSHQDISLCNTTEVVRKMYRIQIELVFVGFEEIRGKKQRNSPDELTENW